MKNKKAKLTPAPAPQETIKVKYLSYEDEIKLDEEFSERERGGIGSLIRAILTKYEKHSVEIEIHRSFLARSYFSNPSALVQQIGYSPGHAHIKAWRSGDSIFIRASQEDFASARSWTGQLAEKLLELPETNETGGVPYLDVKWEDIPFTYQHVPSLVAKRTTPQLQRCNNHYSCETKSYQSFLRVWLHRSGQRRDESMPPSKYHLQRASEL